MIIKNCYSYGNNCPCSNCERECYGCADLLDKDFSFDTEKLCTLAKDYCEAVNGHKVGEKNDSQEAVDLLDTLDGMIEDNHNSDYDSAFKMAIKALEKQIPKKILYRKQNYGTPWLCCECEADQTPTEFFSTDGSEPKEKHTFCWKCGQKLDWGDYK